MRTRFVADVSRPVPFNVYTLSAPYRVVVDLPAVKVRLPGGGGRGLVEAYSHGATGEGRSRIVIRVSGPVLVERSVMERRRGRTAQLVLDLAETDPATFLDRQRAQMARGAAMWSASTVRAAPVAPSRQGSSKPVIVIDPGHGGFDSGAIAPDRTEEKGLVLAFARALAKRLAAKGRYRVLMTRESDHFVSLDGRRMFAMENHAQLFVSIHADLLPRRYASVRGTTVYTGSRKASDAVARLIAKSENQADILAGAEFHVDEKLRLVPAEMVATSKRVVPAWLDELVMRETKIRSREFAEVLLDHLKPATRLNANPHRFAAFRVLKIPIPAVLIELGYLSNAQDRRHLSSKGWRSKASRAVASAIDRYFNERLFRPPFLPAAVASTGR